MLQEKAVWFKDVNFTLGAELIAEFELILNSL